MLELRATTTNERGDIKITITPERAQQIFIEFPVVKRAYDENVPDPVYASRAFLCFKALTLIGFAKTALAGRVLDALPLFKIV
jgi:hypothetical protein